MTIVSLNTIQTSWENKTLGTGILTLIFLLLPWIFIDYGFIIFLTCQMVVFALLSLSVSFLYQNTGYLSLGHVLFFAVSSYAVGYGGTWASHLGLSGHFLLLLMLLVGMSSAIILAWSLSYLLSCIPKYIRQQGTNPSQKIFSPTEELIPPYKEVSRKNGAVDLFRVSIPFILVTWLLGLFGYWGLSEWVELSGGVGGHPLDELNQALAPIMSGSILTAIQIYYYLLATALIIAILSHQFLKNLFLWIQHHKPSETDKKPIDRWWYSYIPLSPTQWIWIFSAGIAGIAGAWHTLLQGVMSSTYASPWYSLVLIFMMAISGGFGWNQSLLVGLIYGFFFGGMIMISPAWYVYLLLWGSTILLLFPNGILGWLNQQQILWAEWRKNKIARCYFFQAGGGFLYIVAISAWGAMFYHSQLSGETTALMRWLWFEFDTSTVTPWMMIGLIWLSGLTLLGIAQRYYRQVLQYTLFDAPIPLLLER